MKIICTICKKDMGSKCPLCASAATLTGDQEEDARLAICSNDKCEYYIEAFVETDDGASHDYCPECARVLRDDALRQFELENRCAVYEPESSS